MRGMIFWDDLDFHASGDKNEADESVSFGLDGQAYSIDLTGPHADELRKALARFVEVAEKVPAMARIPRAPRPRVNDGIKAFCEDPANAIPYDWWHTKGTGKTFYKQAARRRYDAWVAAQSQGGTG